MEVMLEIYKTLGVLNMQWRRKEGITMPEIGPPTAEGYPDEVVSAIEQWTGETGQTVQMGKKAPAKKEAGAAEKAAQNLYLVETRARYGDIMVSPLYFRMFGKLKSQVRMDLQLYRVDASNYLVDFRNIGYYRAPDAVLPEGEEMAKMQQGKEGIGGVSGPFHFLEMACQLIAELASG